MMPVYWYNLIADKSESMTNKEIIDIAFRALELLMPKVAVLPATPGDSVSNALEAFHALNALAPLNTPLISNPDANGNFSSGTH